MLGRILSSTLAVPDHSRLLVGNDSRDDAAVYALDDERAVISTTDFFMPIVDDPHDFGRIAAANAISDVYAMGGRPLMAIGILGWPVSKLPAEVASQVLEGGRAVCMEAGIPLAGGHSIDNPEPIFGLAVTGLVDIAHLKRNDRAQAGDVLFLTKPIGVGLLTTAEKRGILLDSDRGVAADAMRRINAIGGALGPEPGVHAMTDVTGFGLLGHLVEVAQGSDLCAHLDVGSIPHLTDLTRYLDAGTVPGGTRRNFAAVQDRVVAMSDRTWQVLADPQTNGGLLIAVDPAAAQRVAGVLAAAGWHAEPVGHMAPARDDGVRITLG